MNSRFWYCAVVVLFCAGCLDLNGSSYLFDAGVGSAPDAGDAPGCSRACVTPPVARCLGPMTLEAFASHGVCSATNGCAYTPVHVSCAEACDAGRCVGEPCAGAFCDAPQAPVCADATHVRVFEAMGQCSQGSCSYQSMVQECPGGCDQGVCKGNLCAGVSCTAAPAASCIASNVLRVFEQPGTCSAGACRYQPRDVTCAQPEEQRLERLRASLRRVACRWRRLDQRADSDRAAHLWRLARL